MFNAQENAWDAIDYGYIGPLLNTLVNKLLDYKWWWPCNLCFGLDENCLHAWHGFSRFHPKILKHFCSFISVFLTTVRVPSCSRVWNRYSVKFLHQNFNSFLHQSRHFLLFFCSLFFFFLQKLINVPLCLFRTLE